MVASLRQLDVLCVQTYPRLANDPFQTESTLPVFPQYHMEESYHTEGRRLDARRAQAFEKVQRQIRQMAL